MIILSVHSVAALLTTPCLADFEVRAYRLTLLALQLACLLSPALLSNIRETS